MHVLVNDRERPPNVNHYHSDGIFRAEPEFASMLRAVEVPEAGGDTIFVGMRAAYDALSTDMKSYLANKQAINDFMKLHGSPKKARSWEGGELGAHGKIPPREPTGGPPDGEGAPGDWAEESLYLGELHSERRRSRRG